MDHFGLGNALQAMAHSLIRGMRGTGRTTSLVESLRDGDRVVCLNVETAEELRRLLAQRSIAASVVLVPPNEPERLYHLGTSEGRTLFDHPWLEAFYLLQLEHAAASVDHLQREASGFSSAHVLTREQAREHTRRYWRGPRST